MTIQRILLAMTVALATPVVLAQSSGGEFSVTRSVIASGGATATGGAFSLTGTIGQSATAVSSGGEFTVSGGFWPRTPLDRPDPVFLDGFEG